MHALRRLALAVSFAVALTAFAAAPASADILERSLGLSGGISFFGHTCPSRPDNTVWLEVNGDFTGPDSRVSDVTYENFSSRELIVAEAQLHDAFGNVVYLRGGTLPGAPFGESRELSIAVDFVARGKAVYVEGPDHRRALALWRPGGQHSRVHALMWSCAGATPPEATFP